MSDYANGFKDGFAAGLEEGKKLAPKQTRLDDYVFGQRDTCPKCGIKISGTMNYTCQSINCPTFFQAHSYGDVGKPMTGAAGSMSDQGLEEGYSYK